MNTQRAKNRVKRKIAIPAGRMTGTLREKLERVAAIQERLGTTIGFALGLDWEGEFALTTSAQKMKEIRRLAQDLGVQFASIGAFAFWPPNPCLTDEDLARRRRAIDFVQRQVELAHEFGASTALVAISNRSKPDMDPRQLEDLALDSLSRIEIPQGVVLAVEHLLDRFGTSLIRFARFMGKLRELKGSSAGWCFDPANIIAERVLSEEELRLESGETIEEVTEPTTWLKELGCPAVVHVKGVDLTCGEPQVPDDLEWEAALRYWPACLWVPDLMGGSIDWAMILQLLEEHGYREWFVYEGQKFDEAAIAELWDFANIPV